ncbi:MAG: hypothetical protein AAFX93_07330 [Verrucomicrobiota bacterium]
MKLIRLLPWTILLFALGVQAQDSDATANQVREEIDLREPLPEASDQIAEQLIATYFKAIGGYDRYMGIRSVRTDATITEGMNEHRATTYIIPPNRIREEITVRKLGKDHVTVLGFDGENAWEYDLSVKNPFPEELKGSKKKALREAADFYGILANWKERGCVVEYLGAVTSRKHKHYLVKLYKPDGHTQYYYFDPKSYLITRIGWRENRNGTVVDQDIFPTKYRKFGGLWLPDKYERAMEDQVYGTIVVHNIELNQSLSDDLFTEPKVKEVWIRGKNSK